MRGRGFRNLDMVDTQISNELLILLVASDPHKMAGSADFICGATESAPAVPIFLCAVDGGN
jgi:hypothetical protein